MIINDSIDLLGKKVKDKITCSSGVVTSVCFDLYGCIQVIVKPQKIDKEGNPIASIGWIDINRLSIISNKLVMNRPDFKNKYKKINEVQGCASKPIK